MTTIWQTWACRFQDLVTEARDELDADGWRAFVATAEQRVIRETSRLARGEASRLARGEGREEGER